MGDLSGNFQISKDFQTTKNEKKEQAIKKRLEEEVAALLDQKLIDARNKVLERRARRMAAVQATAQATAQIQADEIEHSDDESWNQYDF